MLNSGQTGVRFYKNEKVISVMLKQMFTVLILFKLHSVCDGTVHLINGR
jgi:hypothetical protein